MKAIVQDTYGTPEVLELREIAQPQIGERQVLVRVRAAGVNIADWALMSGLPLMARPAPLYGLRKPNNGVRGTDVAGIVEAVGAGVTAVQARRRGVRRVHRLVRRVRRRIRGRAGAEAGQPDLRAGRHGSDGGPRGPPSHPRPRQGPCRTGGPDQRGVRRHRHVRRPDREGARRRGHGGRAALGTSSSFARSGPTT